MTARILIAEDDEEMRRLLVSLLREEGYEVEAVGDGDHLQATLFCHVERFDLILTDIRLPRRSGLEVVEAIRAQGLQVPVIVMTAYGDDHMRDRASQASASFLDKPFEAQELSQAVRSLLASPVSSRC